MKNRLIALIVLIIGAGIGYFVYGSEHTYVFGKEVPTFIKKYSFKLGLDLKGGSHLVYRADTTKVPNSDVGSAMNSLRDVIERRINAFGVSEPVIQIQEAGFTNNNEQRLTVDLPGVTDIAEAIKTIGETPNLQFKVENPDFDPEAPMQIQATPGPDGQIQLGSFDPYAGRYLDTALTGRYLKKATVEFNQTTYEPIIGLNFNDEGSKLFEEMTKNNVGKTIAIYLDGQILSAPVVNQAITGGQATITGSFTPQEAKTLVGRLNSGALPIPVELISTQTIGPTLGSEAIHKGLHAGLIALILISIFFIIWYRLPGVLAVISLGMYVLINLALFKLIPVTITAAGIAGFIISMGIAVDANILIFERIKEELKRGKNIQEGIKDGFARAWTSISDSNLSTLITSLILFWFGTALIKGFALTLGIGILVSLLSAVVITRVFLKALHIKQNTKVMQVLFGSGISHASKNKNQ
jgi:preprotein translocase subunit SecD